MPPGKLNVYLRKLGGSRKVELSRALKDLNPSLATGYISFYHLFLFLSLQKKLAMQMNNASRDVLHLAVINVLIELHYSLDRALAHYIHSVQKGF
jgi:hypothetical protein